MLQSPEFVRSPVLRRLLEYLIEQTLAGNGQRLKAYQIAVEGLGRDDSFDPQSDSYPRVQVGRLRKMLDLHYAGLDAETASSRQRIKIPVGSYNVELTPIHPPGAGLAETSDTPEAATAVAMPPADVRVAQSSGSDEAAAPSSALAPAYPPGSTGPARARAMDKGWLVWALPVVLLFAALYAIWLFARPDPAEGHGTMQAQIAHVTIATDPASGSDALNTAAQIAEMHLQRFEMLAVSMGVHEDAADSRHRDREYQLLLRGGSLPASAQDNAIFLALRHVASGTTLWSYELPRSSSAIAAPDYERAIGEGISIVARSGGLIAQHQRKLVGTDMSPGYPCLIQYDMFRQRRDPAIRPRLNACLRESLDAYPDEPLFLQALSYMVLSEPQKGRQQPLTPSDEGRALAEAALAFDGRSSLAQIAVARSAVARGNCPRAIAFSRRAVESNPLEPDTLGIAGSLLMSCGDYPGAQSALERALTMNSQPGGFQTSALVIVRLVNGQPAEALDLAMRADSPELNAQPNFLLAKALAHAANGRLELARQNWSTLEQTVGVPPGTPAADTLSRFSISPFFNRRMAAEVAQAGLASAES